MKTSGKSDIIELALEVRRETENAFGFFQGDEDEDGREKLVWCPKSQVEDNGDGTYSMPEWLAKNKGLI